jgi:hypothetical protein
MWVNLDWMQRRLNSTTSLVPGSVAALSNSTAGTWGTYETERRLTSALVMARSSTDDEPVIRVGSVRLTNLVGWALEVTGNVDLAWMSSLEMWHLAVDGTRTGSQDGHRLSHDVRDN